MNNRDNETTRTSGTVVALFHNQADAERAIQRLKERGFAESQIGVAIKDRSRQDELIEGTGTQAAEGAATGAIGGGVLGGVIGLLAGVGRCGCVGGGVVDGLALLGALGLVLGHEPFEGGAHDGGLDGALRMQLF